LRETQAEAYCRPQFARHGAGTLPDFKLETTMAIKAPDLTKQAPRSPRVRLGGYAILPRMIDKGRAALAGMLGEYNYGRSTSGFWTSWAWRPRC
jgi:hypothetical protein